MHLPRTASPKASVRPPSWILWRWRRRPGLRWLHAPVLLMISTLRSLRDWFLPNRSRPRDELLQILLLPGATLLGAISNVYDSVKQLEKNTVNVDKDLLLEQKPVCSAFSNLNVLKIEPNQLASTVSRYLRRNCSGLLMSVGRDPERHTCQSCGDYCCTPAEVVFIDRGGAELEDVSVGSVHVQTTVAAGKPAKAGFVKKSLTYSITDDLQILPASSITV